MVASKYIAEGEKNEITEGGKKYTLHDYGAEKKMWANAKTEITGANGEKQETWWVWIPRYAYKIDSAAKTIDIKYVGIDNKLLDPKLNEESKKLPEGYTVHPAFTVKEKYKDEDGNEIEKVVGELKGIWMSKYEPSYAPLIPSNNGIVPDMSGFNEDNTYIELYNKTNVDGSITESFNEIPLKEADLGTINNGNKWYDYANKIWANIRTEVEGANGEKQETWWVWIPRYAYKINNSGQDAGRTMEVIYVGTNNKPLDTKKYGTKLPEDYIVHPAFTIKEKQEDGTEKIIKELKGIWMSKYEPSYAPLIPSNKGIVPDMSGFNEENTYIELYNGTGFDAVPYREADLDTINNENKWYDYSNKIWANVKTEVNGKEAWWVWIPRYAYKLDGNQKTIDVIYVGIDNKPLDKEKYGEDLPGGYIIHPGFTVTEQDSEGNTNVVKELKGIWMSKYEPSQVTN